MKKNKVMDADCVFEKKRWISITGLCNNNCLFCLDKERPDKYHKNKEEIKKEIHAAREQGCTKLILSGGDPTIHPHIIEFVKYASELGFSKIQVITNGRMFASKHFTKEIIESGLHEVTFSIHGFNSTIHDELTQVPGSFKQIKQGVKNVRETDSSMIINTDTCVTLKNYVHMPKIIKYIVDVLKINEVNLMTMVPQGNAWEYKKDIMCEYEHIAPYVKEVIDFCIKRNVVLWLSRFPAEFLEGQEEFIEDPYKLVDDVRGRLDMLKDTTNPKCKGERCNYCCLKNICDKFIKINEPDIKTKTKNPKEFEITRKNYKKLDNFVNKKEKLVFRLKKPLKRVKEYEKVIPKIEEIMPFLKKVDYENIYVKDIPPCRLIKARIKKIKYIPDDKINYAEFIKEGKKDYMGLAEEVAVTQKIKKQDCKMCIYYNQCTGLYLNYIRLFGFKELLPIKKKEQTQNEIKRNIK